MRVISIKGQDYFEGNVYCYDLKVEYLEKYSEFKMENLRVFDNTMTLLKDNDILEENDIINIIIIPIVKPYA